MVDDFQQTLDGLPTTPEPPDYRQLLTAVGYAVMDALGPHGGQPELKQRWEHEADRGRRLQVAGHIDLPTLERQVAVRMLGIFQRFMAEPDTLTTFLRGHRLNGATKRCGCGERGITDHTVHLAWVLREHFTIPGESFDDL